MDMPMPEGPDGGAGLTLTRSLSSRSMRSKAAALRAAARLCLAFPAPALFVDDEEEGAVIREAREEAGPRGGGLLTDA